MKKYVISQWRNSIQVSYLNLIPFFQMRKKKKKNPQQYAYDSFARCNLKNKI